QEGRFHPYEGHPAATVEGPVRVAAALGVHTTLLTNAAGGIRNDLLPGTLVLLDDFLDLQFRIPHAGTGPGTRWTSGAPLLPDPELGAVFAAAARRAGVPLARGSYGAVLGPNFETRAEIRMLRILGADVVGMSTVPEVRAARTLGLRVAALSLVVNPATGLAKEPLAHEAVLEVARAARDPLHRLLLEALPSLP